MITIKLKDARDLIHQNKGKFVCVDQVDNGPYVEVIFKEKEYTQLYAFYYYRSDDPDLGITIDTVQKFDSFLGDDDNLDVEVALTKKVTKQITVTKYIEDNPNDWWESL